MTVLEASSKQEPEVKEVPTGPLEDDDLEPLALVLAQDPAPAPAPARAPRPPQDLISLRLAQEKGLKRQLEEEQKVKPTGMVEHAASASSSMPAVVLAARVSPTPAEEALENLEKGPECETPAIFISMDDNLGLAEATLLDSGLEGPLPKEAAAVGSSSKDERSPQSLNHTVEEALLTSSLEAREPESKGNS